MNSIDFPRIKKNVLIAGGFVAAAFTAAGAFLWFWSADRMREEVAGQFNAEQAVIAENVSHLIERELNTLKKELGLLSKNISLQPLDPESAGELVQNAFSRLLESGVRKIIVTDLSSRKSYAYRPHHGMTFIEENIDTTEFPEAASDREQSVRISEPQVKPGEITVTLSTGESKNPSLGLSFEVNVSWFLTPLLKNVRSGKTGYAWIIDQKGMFLFHPRTAFVGKNAFEIRKITYPDIPLGIIDFIQKEKMLNGRAGTGWYYSGWHRGITGEVKKLIAYCPIPVSENPMQKWSVAVVAPTSEIESALRKGNFRQSIYFAFIVSVILVGATAYVFLEIRWSRILEIRVDERTEALKKSEEKYRSLVESAEDFIFTVDAGGILQSLNSFTANFFGGQTQHFVGKNLSCLFPHDVAAQQLSRVKLVYKYGKSVRDEFSWNMGDYRIWISANFMPLKDDENRVNAVLCIARDITENKNLEKQLINTEKLASMGTLAAGVAHEINNPLGVILGFCDLLVRKTERDTQAYEDLKTIERQGLLCKQVVENLLSFARLSEEVSEYCDLNQCLEEIIKVVKHTLGMNNIELVLDLAGQIPMVAGDSRQLQQVFLNLINNSVAAMPSGGILKLKSFFERSTRRAVAVFADNGIGIRPEDMDHIYEPFFTTKPEGTGTGLGLFVSYGIISKFGGTIECVSHTEESRDKPKGTIFTIKLLTKS
jgi:PAS domain S-box-containing protein